VIKSLSLKHPEITAIEHGVTTGDIVLVQDADLEHDPEEYPSILKPILDGRADVVLAPRFRGPRGGTRALFLSLAADIFTDFNLTDMETC
jgi:hypothetical protein